MSLAAGTKLGPTKSSRRSAPAGPPSLAKRASVVHRSHGKDLLVIGQMLGLIRSFPSLAKVEWARCIARGTRD